MPRDGHVGEDAQADLRSNYEHLEHLGLKERGQVKASTFQKVNT